jgi:outer membrane lipoprotein LolB
VSGAGRLGPLLVLVGAGLLTACGVQAPGPRTTGQEARDAYQERARRLADLAGWTLSGRVSVQGGEQSGQVRVRWQRDAQGSRLEVRNPFGQTLIRLTRDPSGLRLRDDRGRVYTGGAARQVLRARLGWRVPVGRLGDWVLGLARRGGTPAALDGLGRPLRIEAGPWRVAYPRYVEVKGVWLPRELQVGRDGLDLRIRVDDWDLRWAGGGKGAAA